MRAQIQSRTQFRFSHHVHSGHTHSSSQSHLSVPSVTSIVVVGNMWFGQPHHRGSLSLSTRSGRVQSQSHPVVQSFGLVPSPTHHSCRGSHRPLGSPGSARPSHRRFDGSLSSVGVQRTSLSSVLSRVFTMSITIVTSCQLEAASTLSTFIKSSAVAGQIKTTSSSIGGAASLRSEHSELHGS